MSEMTPTETVDWFCKRFEAADCVESLETQAVALGLDIGYKQDYTLIDGASDRMWAAFSKRLEELEDAALVNERCETFGTSVNMQMLENEVKLLQRHIAEKRTYTLLPGALGRMRGVYAKRLAELRETLDTAKPTS